MTTDFQEYPFRSPCPRCQQPLQSYAEAVEHACAGQPPQTYHESNYRPLTYLEQMSQRLVCKRCGAAVLDIEAHDELHLVLKAIVEAQGGSPG